MKDLLEEYVPRIYRFAVRLTHDPHAAEDLTQETVLRAWRQRGRLRNPQAARVWLFRITVNLWRDQLRRGQSRVARAGPLPDDCAGQTPTPDCQAVGQEEVRRALAARAPAGRPVPERLRGPVGGRNRHRAGGSLRRGEGQPFPGPEKTPRAIARPV